MYVDVPHLDRLLVAAPITTRPMHLYQHPIVSLEANLFGHLLQSQVIGAVERLAQA
jgi:hypothetical protein